jgi:hypothetical protein
MRMNWMIMKVMEMSSLLTQKNKERDEVSNYAETHFKKLDINFDRARLLYSFGEMPNALDTMIVIERQIYCHDLSPNVILREITARLTRLTTETKSFVNPWLTMDGLFITNAHFQPQSSRYEDGKLILQNFWNLSSKGKQKLLANYSKKSYLEEKLLNCFAENYDFSENSFAKNGNDFSYKKTETCAWTNYFRIERIISIIILRTNVHMNRMSSRFHYINRVTTDSKGQIFAWVSPLTKVYRDVKQPKFSVLPNYSKLIKNLHSVSKHLAILYLELLDVFDFLPERKESNQGRDFILNIPEPLLFAASSEVVRA